MRFVALATDYDGTLAREGCVSAETIEALRRFRASGRRVILLTGRTFASVLSVYPNPDEFDLVVAENGATLYSPAANTEKTLTDPPPRRFLDTLEARGVLPLEVGRVIVATSLAQRQNVLDVIQQLGLELHIVFNKGSLMILPGGINKATGLQAALEELHLSPHNVAGIGDAENDNAFLAACEFSAAVENALPSIKERVHLVTRQADGRGVTELIDSIVRDDLHQHKAWYGQPILIGHRDNGEGVKANPCGVTLLAGPSGGGKSRLITAFLEGLLACKYQFCAIDPEGDYELSGQVPVLGRHQHIPSTSEIVELLARPEQSVIVNLLNIEVERRPAFFAALLKNVQELRTKLGRPHCIVVDEAHHFLASDSSVESPYPLRQPNGLVLITVKPDRLPRFLLQSAQLVLAAGADPDKTILSFCSHAGIPAPEIELPQQSSQMLAWRPGSDSTFVFTPLEAQAARTRHRRKYAEGELAPERSFYFRGPEGKLNLRAYNLMNFLQLMDGLDDETWLFHLRRGDYSGWLRREIKDEELAREAEKTEQSSDISAPESRARFRSMISSRYTLPA